jgi:hypothetical protein
MRCKLLMQLKCFQQMDHFSSLDTIPGALLLRHELLASAVWRLHQACAMCSHYQRRRARHVRAASKPRQAAASGRANRRFRGGARTRVSADTAEAAERAAWQPAMSVTDLQCAAGIVLQRGKQASAHSDG